MSHRFPDEALVAIGEAAYEAAKATALGDGKTADEAQVLGAQARLDAMKAEIAARAA